MIYGLNIKGYKYKFNLVGYEDSRKTSRASKVESSWVNMTEKYD